MLTDIDLPSLEYICLNLRERDKVEIFNCSEHDNPMQLAWEAFYLMRNKGRARVAWFNGRPCAVAAFTESWAGHWQVWMFGTDDFKAGAADLIRWARREAREILSVCEGKRLQCDSMVGHDEAHKMIMALGGKPEGEPMKSYGKDGSDFQRFVWFPEDSAVLEAGFTRAA